MSKILIVLTGGIATVGMLVFLYFTFATQQPLQKTDIAAYEQISTLAILQNSPDAQVCDFILPDYIGNTPLIGTVSVAEGTVALHAEATTASTHITVNRILTETEAYSWGVDQGGQYAFYYPDKHADVSSVYKNYLSLPFATTVSIGVTCASVPDQTAFSPDKTQNFATITARSGAPIEADPLRANLPPSTSIEEEIVTTDTLGAPNSESLPTIESDVTVDISTPNNTTPSSQPIEPSIAEQTTDEPSADPLVENWMDYLP